ncbi:MAG: hypothetical protein V1839_00390 [archaeon]
MNKKAIEITTGTIVFLVIGVFAMFAAITIYQGISSTAAKGISAQGGEENVTLNITIEELSKPCYNEKLSGSKVNLLQGINKVCWSPPPIYGGLIPSYSPLYVCPAGYVMGSVFYMLELAKYDRVLISDSNGIYYAYLPPDGTMGPITTQKLHTLSYEKFQKNSARFEIATALDETRYYSSNKGAAVIGIECVRGKYASKVVTLNVSSRPVTDLLKGLQWYMEMGKLYPGNKCIGDKYKRQISDTPASFAAYCYMLGTGKYALTTGGYMGIYVDVKTDITDSGGSVTVPDHTDFDVSAVLVRDGAAIVPGITDVNSKIEPMPPTNGNEKFLLSAGQTYNLTVSAGNLYICPFYYDTDCDSNLDYNNLGYNTLDIWRRV